MEYQVGKMNDRKARRLMSFMKNRHAPEQKSLPANAGDVFLVRWKLIGGKKLRASLLTRKEEFGYEYDITQEIETQPHTHDYLELGYIVSGNFTQVIEGRQITFHKHELCLIDTGSVHYDLLEGDAEVLFFGISNRLFDIVSQGGAQESGLMDFLRTSLLTQKASNQYLLFKPDTKRTDTEERMSDLIKILVSELRIGDVGSDYIVFGLVLRLFQMLTTEYEFTLTREQNSKRSQMVGDEILEYIQEHFQDISVAKLVEEFHYNEDYFNRLILKRKNMTYSEYVQSLRLEHAKELLLQTNMSVDEIVHECGYQNKGFFYRLFQKRYGMTPAAYRKQME